MAQLKRWLKATGATQSLACGNWHNSSTHKRLISSNHIEVTTVADLKQDLATHPAPPPAAGLVGAQTTVPQCVGVSGKTTGLLKVLSSCYSFYKIGVMFAKVCNYR